MPALRNAHALVIAHNHPSGIREVSSAENMVQEILQNSGNLMEIHVLDQVVIGRKGEYFR
ncbi:MAG: hypothetical protein HGA62_10810 [Chlorobiaceae bacterium]|nr:hypothetical protein [Chlorobiaceae bacterium]NTV61685.1 hypothetical protein [Chlorobiaceae bacterium]